MNKYKRLVKWAGTSLILLSLIFIFYLLWKQGEEVAGILNDPGICKIFLAGVIFYSTISIILPLAWWMVLAKLESRHPTFLTCYWVYNKTQIAKYLPGNVMNFVGRQIVAKTFHFKQFSVLIATVTEISSLVMATLMLSLFGIIFLEVNINFIQQYEWIFYVFIVMSLVVFIGSIFIRRSPYFFEKLQKYFTGIPKNFLKLFMGICTVHVGYFLAMGIVFSLLSILILGMKTDKEIWVTLILGYSFSWLIGFIAPGVPGGIGIREMGLTAILSTVASSAEALTIALFFRIVTVFGDLFSFFSTYLIPKGARISLNQEWTKMAEDEESIL